jgi:hypothetical protein
LTISFPAARYHKFVEYTRHNVSYIKASPLQNSHIKISVFITYDIQAE